MANQKVVMAVFSPVLDIEQLLKDVKYLRSLQKKASVFRLAQFQDELRFCENMVDTKLSQFFEWYEDKPQQLELFPQYAVLDK